MENNPFDDSDNVQQPLAGNKEENINIAGGAYDDDHKTEFGQHAQAAVQMGAMGAQQIQSAYDEGTAQQRDQHELPPPPGFCQKLFNWFPIRYFAFIGGAAVIVCTIFDFLWNQNAFIQGIIRCYLLIFGFVIMMIESPVWTCSRWFQLKIFFWYRILSRMWGRAWFYLFVCILCFAEFEESNPGEFTIIAGLYLFVICIVSFIFSKLAASKFNRIFAFVAAGTEGDEMKKRFEAKFDELAVVKPGQIGSAEITKLASQAGRILSNAERHVVQSYLDESCNGYVSKEDFMKQFMRLTTVPQKFL